MGLLSSVQSAVAPKRVLEVELPNIWKNTSFQITMPNSQPFHEIEQEIGISFFFIQSNLYRLSLDKRVRCVCLFSQEVPYVRRNGLLPERYVCWPPAWGIIHKLYIHAFLTTAVGASGHFVGNMGILLDQAGMATSFPFYMKDLVTHRHPRRLSSALN